VTEAAAAIAELEVGVDGNLGIIALNRPQAINALSLGMVQGIAAQLEAWRDDERVRAVLFEGRGRRGFCSGGDVRAVRAQVLAGRWAAAQQFFADEYRMNGLIAGYGKPVIALCEGIVMGGGIGIAGHAAFRIAADNTKFAMPEAAIGFVCDVGVNAILARAPVERALLFELSGLSVGPADALALGLTDCVVPAIRIAAIRAALPGIVGSGDVETALVAMLGAESIDAGAAELCARADALAAEFDDPDAASIVAGIAAAARDDPRVAPIAGVLATRCPTSLEAILQSHRAARRLQDVAPILALDLRMAAFMTARPDFAEGVRAVLVDKDGRPKWAPADSADVPLEEIAAVVAGTALSAESTAGA
jgi:enoyl-CoA hydratase